MTRKRKRRLKSQPRRKKRSRKILKWSAIVIGVLVAISFFLILPLRWLEPATTAFMLRDNTTPQLHEWTDWSDLGSAMPLAVIASEDQRFADHFGVDIRSIKKSLDAAEDGARLRGASTISQQLAKNLFLSPSRSLVRKGVEAYLSVVIEICLPKRRILEIYVNIIELGPGAYGVGAASLRYFGKVPASLTDSEAALLAAVLPNPIRLQAGDPSAYVRERQEWIVEQMQRLRREGWLTRLE
jgi:monofunctional biosynthetic peptidoglycan transglycosylase